ncbi:MAG: hypothetical protein FWC19_00650 [Treponema sp.]|nr:hypothetical protein [Treponema sp.]MCL2271300.1 hypothetical protein [Treponema sp.]
MKKALFLLIFPVLTVSILAEDFKFPNRNLYIEGTAEIAAHQAFFMGNFKMEASALGFTVVEDKEEAAYTFRFADQSYDDDWDPSIKFIILISLILNEGERELLSFGWPYAELDDMYEYNQYVFFRAVVLIPGISEDDFTGLVMEDNTWRDKWLYFRASFDYPIVFNVLKGDGLYDGVAVYSGDIRNPAWVNILDHKINALPGLTAGVEVQFLSFVSLEVNFQLGLGDTTKTRFTELNMSAGAQLKFPFKLFGNFMIEPYGAFVYPIAKSSEFKKFPMFLLGGGVQVCVKGGKSGAFFVDVNYIFPLPVGNLGEVITYNPFAAEPVLGVVKPDEIHYNRFSIGIGVGYKFGLLNRK